MVILDVSPLLRIYGFIDAGVRDIDPYPLPEGTGDGVCGMDPTVCVEHILRDVLSVNTVDGISHILPRCDNQGKRQKAHHSEGVMEPEDCAVNVHMADFDQVFEATEDVQHFEGQLGGTLGRVNEHSKWQSQLESLRAMTHWTFFSLLQVLGPDCTHTWDFPNSIFQFTNSGSFPEKGDSRLLQAGLSWWDISQPRSKRPT